VSGLTAFATPVVISLASWYVEGWMLHDAHAPNPYTTALMSTLVDIEAIGFAEMSTGITKAIAGRCRPRSWKTLPNGTSACVPDSGNPSEEYRAFPSGHTAAPSALAGARFVTAVRAKGRFKKLHWVTFAFAEAASFATAALRVDAGAHSWSDVFAGWAIGHLAGAGIAAVHFPQPRLGRLGLSPAGFTWSGAF
jgi:membrane-associated phospholipid phosphatase